MFICFHSTQKFQKHNFLLGKEAHHAEGLVNPKVRAQKKVTHFRYPREHVDSENIILKIGSRSFSTNFFQNVFLKIHKMWLKLAKIQTFLAIFTFFRSSWNTVLERIQ
jgi:hypothetical protein